MNEKFKNWLYKPDSKFDDDILNSRACHIACRLFGIFLAVLVLSLLAVRLHQAITHHEPPVALTCPAS